MGNPWERQCGTGTWRHDTSFGGAPHVQHQRRKLQLTCPARPCLRHFAISDQSLGGSCAGKGGDVVVAVRAEWSRDGRPPRGGPLGMRPYPGPHVCDLGRDQWRQPAGMPSRAPTVERVEP